VLHAGMGTALDHVSPGIVWHGEEAPPVGPQPEFDARGRTIMLAPSSFWTGEPWVGLLPNGKLAVVYALADSGTRAGQRAPDRRTALEQLLGQTRAAVLCSLTSPCGTTELASRVDMSVATTSEHAAVLRASGLIFTTRRGRSVEHTLTDLGRQLVFGC